MNLEFEQGGIRHVTPRHALELCLQGAVILDVREPELNRYKMFGVPEVVYCPLSVLKCHYDSLPDSRPLIVADAAGLRSREAVELLRNRGITEGIINLAGGLIEWERDGLPLVIDKTERLTGSCMCQLRPRDKGN